MPEWLTSSLGAGPPIAPHVVVIRLVLALVLGGLVAQIYKRTQAADEIPPSFPPTLVLLSVLIAMVTQVVGDNVARAFSLVGALSIVRFRTVVRDTEDTAYVIFAVVVGMAVGAGAAWVALLGLIVVAIAAMLMMPRGIGASATGRDRAPQPGFILELRAGLGRDVEALVAPVMDAHLGARRLMSIATAKQGLAMEFAYDVQFRGNASPDALVRELNRLDGVQGVDVRVKDFV